VSNDKLKDVFGVYGSSTGKRRTVATINDLESYKQKVIQGGIVTALNLKDPD
jgi:hypothetical protein